MQVSVAAQLTLEAARAPCQWECPDQPWAIPTGTEPGAQSRGEDFTARTKCSGLEASCHLRALGPVGPASARSPRAPGPPAPGPRPGLPSGLPPRNPQVSSRGSAPHAHSMRPLSLCLSTVDTPRSPHLGRGPSSLNLVATSLLGHTAHGGQRGLAEVPSPVALTMPTCPSAPG